MNLFCPITPATTGPVLIPMRNRNWCIAVLTELVQSAAIAEPLSVRSASGRLRQTTHRRGITDRFDLPRSRVPAQPEAVGKIVQLFDDDEGESPEANSVKPTMSAKKVVTSSNGRRSAYRRFQAGGNGSQDAQQQAFVLASETVHCEMVLTHRSSCALNGFAT